ncbi:MAG: hypothetical protein ABSA11_08110 [Candidatus Bathyarchaeia archaeon]
MPIFQGKGKIEIQLPKTSFAPRETVEGTVTMLLNEPVKAKGVIVSLSRQEQRETYSGGKRTTTSYTHVYDSSNLDGEKEYPANQRLEYPFKLVGPVFNAPFDPVSSLFKAITRDKSPPSMKFRVDAKLDISHGIDVNNNVEIRILYQ